MTKNVPPKLFPQCRILTQTTEHRTDCEQCKYRDNRSNSVSALTLFMLASLQFSHTFISPREHFPADNRRRTFASSA